MLIVLVADAESVVFEIGVVREFEQTTERTSFLTLDDKNLTAYAVDWSTWVEFLYETVRIFVDEVAKVSGEGCIPLAAFVTTDKGNDEF